MVTKRVHRTYIKKKTTDYTDDTVFFLHVIEFGSLASARISHELTTN